MRSESNLSLSDRAVRLRMALVTLAVAITLVILLAELAVSVPLWAIVAIPLFMTSTLVVQAYTGVCPTHARKGTRATGSATEPVLDPAKRTCLIDRGRTVMNASLAIAAVSTALVLALGVVR